VVCTTYCGRLRHLTFPSCRGRDLAEHYSDTGAFTDQIFGICQLLGFRYAPRIRDLADRRLHPFEKASSYPALEPLIGEPIVRGR
jgi:TnpA family transposase